jgi:hypothetical protein
MRHFAVGAGPGDPLQLYQVDPRWTLGQSVDSGLEDRVGAIAASAPGALTLRWKEKQVSRRKRAPA